MKNINEIVSFLKDKGFVYSGSSIYGGLANSWDYGPLGTLLKDNIKNLWKKFFIDQEENIYHFDSSIMLNSQVWKSSGHIDKFNDPLIDCKSCKERFRSDKLIEENILIKNIDKFSHKEQTKLIKENKVKCPNCSKTDWTDVRSFELMFKTSNSKIDDEHELFLRPETAQGIFINFKNILDTMNLKIPFGVGQLGKAFRNEITPGNFIFRTKEFEQLELEFFLDKKNSDYWFDYFLNKIDLFLNKIGLDKNDIKKYNVPEESLAHYSKKTIDFEYHFPFGWGELLGLANRGDFDLKIHSQKSNESLEFRDQKENKKYFPYVIETSMGVERLFLAIICSSLKTEVFSDVSRQILKLPYELCPYKISVMPLTNKLEIEANNLYKDLLKKDLGPMNFSLGGSIGKRYRKQDLIGTMYCITYDFETLNDHKITIRNRDTMLQERIDIKDIKEYILKNAK